MIIFGSDSHLLGVGSGDGLPGPDRDRVRWRNVPHRCPGDLRPKRPRVQPMGQVRPRGRPGRMRRVSALRGRGTARQHWRRRRRRHPGEGGLRGTGGLLRRHDQPAGQSVEATRKSAKKACSTLVAAAGGLLGPVEVHVRERERHQHTRVDRQQVSAIC